MEEKLMNLYFECIKDLESIGINTKNVGKIDIGINYRSKSIYGKCTHNNPVKSSVYIIKRGRKKIIRYGEYLEHKIDISSWVLDLEDNIIKNTIIHEILHCFPNANNHGEEFKKYAKYVNEKLGYKISRLGNKKEDYEKSKIEYKNEENTYNYKIKCEKCGKIYYRKRLKRNFFKKYRCSICLGSLKLEDC